MGIRAMLSCLEMVPITLLFVHAYPLKPYILNRDPEAADGRPQGLPKSYQGGVGGVRAYLAMINPSENIEGLMFAFRMAREDRRRKKAAGLEYNPLVSRDGTPC